jgi:ATP-dependent 26S proteasome regulatory subunit
LWLRSEPDLTTERFLDYLRSQHLASNVDLREVQPVSLRDLQGVDSVIESLEANIVLPLENDQLVMEFGLKPKRGVLLAGPPGTGKTTVGRALAHRLQSKFFLIDGTCISGTQHFYGQIHHIFEEAKRNAPAILFIDDSDVIFESGQELGLYRYLLTMLDGLESASAARVCVMLTAMDVSSLPPALIRSGRIELWLEMPLPDEPARESILRRHIGDSSALAGLDVTALVRASDGFTGADLKRLIEDGKNLLAYDRARQRPMREALAYFLEAVEAVRANKERYAQAEAHARQQRPVRPVYYDLAGDRVS